MESRVLPAQSPTTRQFRGEEIPFVSITYLSPAQPRVTVTPRLRSHEIDAEFQHDNPMRVVREPWRILQSRTQPLLPYSPSLLLHMLITLEHDETQLWPASAHLLEPS